VWNFTTEGVSASLATQNKLQIKNLSVLGFDILFDVRVDRRCTSKQMPSKIRMAKRCLVIGSETHQELWDDQDEIL
jgi:hypothetical protein